MGVTKNGVSQIERGEQRRHQRRVIHPDLATG